MSHKWEKFVINRLYLVYPPPAPFILVKIYKTCPSLGEYHYKCYILGVCNMRRSEDVTETVLHISIYHPQITDFSSLCNFDLIHPEMS